MDAQSLLETIQSPADVKRLSPEQLQPLADEVRQRLIDVVSQTGGHIGAGLGVVELTVALCRSFDSPLPPLGTRPAFPAEEPSYQPLVPCHTQALPNFNGPLASGPADGGG